MNMRRIVRGGLVAVVAIGGSTALISSAYADTVSTAPECVPAKAAPAWTEIQYKYTPVKNGSGPTYWAKEKPTDKAQTIAVNGVQYINASSVRKIEHPALAAVTCAVTPPQTETLPQAVTLPQFAIEVGSDGPYAIVPFTPHVKTYLYGVQGHPETDAITEDVKVTPDMVGGQFWIGYVPDEGYVKANDGQWHIDFNAPLA